MSVKATVMTIVWAWADSAEQPAQGTTLVTAAHWAWHAANNPCMSPRTMALLQHQPKRRGGTGCNTVAVLLLGLLWRTHALHVACLPQTHPVVNWHK
jgi:hypothetical protein